MSRASRESTPGLLWRHYSAGRATSVLLAALVGIAVLVVALIPRAVAALSETELSHHLHEQSALRVDLAASGRLGYQDTVGDPRTGEEVFATMDAGLATLPAELGPPLSGILGDPQWIAKLPEHDAYPREVRTKALTEMTLTLALGWEDLVRFTDGAAPARWTGSTSDEGEPEQRPPLEVAISAKAAESMGIRVGDIVDFETAPLLVSGIYEPLDPAAGYWEHAFELVRALEVRPPGGQSTLIASVLVNPLTAVGLEAELPSAQLRVWYPAVVDDIHFAEADELLEASQKLTALGRPLPNGEQLAFQSSLSDEIGEVVERIAAMTALLALTGSAPLGVVIAVLALGVRSVLDRRRGALALAAARGATTIQLRMTMLIESVLIALPVSAAALALAVLLVPARVGPEALIVPAVVALATPVLFTVTTSPRLLGTGRADLSTRARRRSRWIVEAVILGVAALALFLLLRRGLVTSSASLRLDPLLAATPLLLALATCVLVLRAYPAPLLALQRNLGRRRGAVGLLGVARAVREPSGGFAGVLAVVVAVSAAVFSLIMGTTVAAGLEASARAEVGAAIRVEAPDLPAALVDDVVAVEGVRAAVAYDVDPQLEIEVGFDGASVTAVFVDLAALSAVRPDLVPAPPTAADGTIPFYASEDIAARMGAPTTTLSKVSAVLAGTLPEEALPGTQRQWILLDSWYAPQLIDEALDPEILLVATEPGADIGAVRAAVEGLVVAAQTESQRDRVESDDSAAVLAAAEARPSTAGLAAALTLAAALSLALGVLAIVLGTVAATGARNRLVGVIRMLGMTPGQVRGLVAWEMAPVAIAAVLAGSALGIGLAFIVAGALDLRPFVGGVEPVPVAIPGLLVATLALAFSVVIVAAGFVAVAAARRISPATTVKMGAE